MPCFRPIEGSRSESGEFIPHVKPGFDVMRVPCGRCVGCRVQRARMWSLRCMHEASLSDRNCFVTLTYSPEFLPPGGSLRYRDFQLFMKRLRKYYAPRPVRYFVCGEYGEALSRPHYHACLFGVDFAYDREPVSTAGEFRHYRSAFLEKTWGLGHCDITDLTPGSAGYAARYILKKVTGDLADSHYSRVDADGVVHRVEPEFARMSVRPGIGKGWFDKFGSEVLPADFVVSDGRQYSVPAYYDKLHKRAGRDLSEVKARREFRAYERRDDSSPRRLSDREEVQRARLASFIRSYER